MALDPSISLEVRTPQFNIPIPQPLQQYGQVLNLQNLMQQQQLFPLELQARQLALQQQQLAVQRQQNVADYFNSLYSQKPSGTPALTQTVAPVQPQVQPVTPPEPQFFSVSPTLGVAGVPTQSSIAGVPDNTLGTPQLTPAPAPAPVAAPVPAPAVTQAPLTIPLAGASSGGFPNVDFGKLYQLDPTGATAKMVMDQEKDFYETQGKRLDNTSKTAAQIGQILDPVLKSDNPELAKNVAVMQLHSAKLIDDATARDWTSRPFDRATVQQFVRAASDVKTQADIDQKNLETLDKAKTGAAKDMQGVYDQASYKPVYDGWPAELQRRWGSIYSPQIRAGIIAGGIDAKDLPKYQQEETQVIAKQLEPALNQGPQAYQAAVARIGDPVQQQIFSNVKTVDDLHSKGMTAAEYQTAQETARQHRVQNAFDLVRTHYEEQKNQREQDIYEMTYGAGANQALQGVDPKLRTQATSNASKANDEYLKTMANADQMQSFIDMARAGNKAAGTNLPVIGVETMNAINGIKRIPREQVAQYQGAGNLYDNIMGKLGKLSAGQPIPADVMQDIESMHRMLRQNAEQAYKTKLDGINQTYHSNFQPVKSGSSVASTPQAGDTRPGKDGRNYRFKGGDPSVKSNWEPM